MEHPTKFGISQGLKWGAWLLPAVWAVCLPAQDAIVTTRVSCTASDAQFRVDGQPYQGAAMFSWPAGSKHTLEIATLQYTPSSTGGRYTFQHWSTAAGPSASASNMLVISADPAVAWYRADLSTEYALTLALFQCPDGGCQYPGTIWVNQVAYRESTDVWLAGGSTVVLAAQPNPGFVFAGWWQGNGQPTSYSFSLNGPLTLYPRFQVARQVQLLTSPDGLQLLADRAVVSAPCTFDWGLETTHSLAPVSPQFDQQGRRWVFQAWGDGGNRDRTFEVPSGAAPLAIVARFVPAVAAVFQTDPVGLTLTIDGIDDISPRYAAWGPGETHTVTAPAHQTDAAGNPWQFRGWSTGTAVTQTIQVTDAQVTTGIRLSAFYDALSRVRVESIPTGLALSLDGADCRTPCEVERPVGSTVRVSGAATFPQGDGARLDFSSWEGASGGALKTVAGFEKVVAHYQWSYQLASSMSPAQAGSWRISPASPDGYYPAGTPVTIGIDAAKGMIFRRWEQDLGGSGNPMPLVMNAPRAVRAIFDRAPDQASSLLVINAAGETPTTAVAAGSVAMLVGENLSDTTAASTADPLPQSLGGVSLICAGRLLPLLFVSPQQINFQLPGDLEPGTHELELHRGNGTTISVSFEAVRDAPGLLAATHADGSPIGIEAPARLGETIALYATGTGPFEPKTMDGFRAPANRSLAVVDPVSVVVQGRSVSTQLAEAAPGTAGVARIQFRIPNDLDLTTPVSVQLQVQDTVSNSLALPLK